jgi:hypothetical protein
LINNKTTNCTKQTTTTKSFIPKASWGKLEMKHMSQNNRDKIRAKNKGKIKGDKKPNQKKRKDNKTLSQKSEKGAGKKP